MRTPTTLALGIAAGAVLAPPGATPAQAQQPDRLQVHSLTGHLATPGREEFGEDLVTRLSVPNGFAVDVFAQGLENPRMLAVHEGGTVFVSEREPGRVIALRDTDGDGAVDGMDPVATDLSYVNGVAIRDGRLYMATDEELHVAAINDDGTLGEVQRLRDDLPQAGQHPNRTIAFGPDGTFYISIGSTCNACDEPDDRHATILRGQPEGGDLEIFAEGLRNAIGFAWHPETGELWGLDHGSDWRGDDDPPEELNQIEQGNHYGWPWCYGDRQVDVYIPGQPQDAESKEAFCERTEPPVLTYQAHSAPMQMVFYTGEQFPEEYRGDAFATMRGSWNRNPPVGYELVRIRFDDGRPTAIEPFITGFLAEDGSTYFGRPTGLALALDGSLLFTDDTNGVVYRLSHAGD